MPDGFAAPTRLVYDDLVATAITRTANGHYTKLYLALRHWLAAEFPFWDLHYSNAEIPPEGATAS
jgi:hypothetical protein